MPTPDPNLPHDSKANQILGVCSAMLVLITVVVAARIWIRLKYAKGGLGADDYCIVVAWVLGAAFDLDPLNRTSLHHPQVTYRLLRKNAFASYLCPLSLRLTPPSNDRNADQFHRS
jgi:hypothetical protein